jgi:colanic acid/amylovoran biosynthesis glycosyltransferase
MSFKVLHIIDCYLPQTMNWLKALLDCSASDCEHHIYASYYISPHNPEYKFVNCGINCSYPISLASKIKQRFLQDKDENDLYRYIHNNGIQILHFHFGHVAIRFEKFITRVAVPFVISLYGFDYEYLIHKKPSTLLAYRRLAIKGGIFIAEGNYSRQLLNSYGITLNHIRIVHLLFPRVNRISFMNYSQPIRLFQAATYIEKKNQLGLVEALQDRHASRFNIQFYGESIDADYSRELKLAIRKKYMHQITMNDKLEFSLYLSKMATSHFVVNLSKRSKTFDTEGGCPVLLKDAFALSKPVISTRHCDIPELVSNGWNGYLLPENDTEAISEVLDNILLLSTKKYLALCHNAMESVNANISGKITANELIQVYESLQ